MERIIAWTLGTVAVGIVLLSSYAVIAWMVYGATGTLLPGLTIN